MKMRYFVLSLFVVVSLANGSNSFAASALPIDNLQALDKAISKITAQLSRIRTVKGVALKDMPARDKIATLNEAFAKSGYSYFKTIKHFSKNGINIYDANQTQVVLLLISPAFKDDEDRTFDPGVFPEEVRNDVKIIEKMLSQD